VINALLTSETKHTKFAFFIVSYVISLNLVSFSSESHIPGRSIETNLQPSSETMILSDNSVISVVVLHTPLCNNLSPIKLLIIVDFPEDGKPQKATTY
jgi:hypothetical protein